MRNMFLVVALVFVSGCTTANVGPYMARARLTPDGEIQMQRCTAEVTFLFPLGIVDDDQECESVTLTKDGSNSDKAKTEDDDFVRN